ncbi:MULTISPECIES: hypothetical protein [Trichocoleus]|uniref:Uncharacterized protein n=1 Tax=Trichocoleus desertorum GB2-A4 TaxID=2933944 RepID=A0ABV0J7U9_9CYAN|nr:hypothetical protein [Trichocoleus sp. FACHB-46]MBD1862677.1 hypothetical protein [Trichocoleus sp. FACHB-46]
MEYWEFLLQKEGDRSWLPLESPDVEILEGRYRVVARSSRANTSVEIRITHQIDDEVSPKRRAQKRFGRTNKDGLMVVFPFTRMKPGLWEIRCVGDLMSDFMGQSWQHMVCLQVLPQEFESETDWDPEWEMQDEETTESSSQSNSAFTTATVADLDQEPTQHQVEPEPEPDALTVEPEVAVQFEPTVEATPEAAPTPNTPEIVNSTHHLTEVTDYSVEQLQYIAERISEAEASLLPEASPDEYQVSAAIANPDHENVPPSAIAVPSETEADSPALGDFAIPATPDPLLETAESASLPLQLVLAEAAYMTSWGQPFTLSGRIELQEPEIATAAIASLPAEVRSGQGELYVGLRDPQSGQILVEVRQPVANPQLPYSFSCTLEIPLSCRTRLLLGEAGFYRSAVTTVDPDSASAESTRSESMDTAIASQSFTLTADVDELLDAIAADLSEAQLLDLPSPATLEAEAEPELEPADSTTDTQPSERAYLNLSFLKVGEQSQDKPPFYIQPSTGSPLPPQIYHSHQSEAAKTPALPVIRGLHPGQGELPAEAGIEADISEIDDSATIVEDMQLEPSLAFIDLDSDLGELDSDLGDVDLAVAEIDTTVTVDLSNDELAETATIPEESEPAVETSSQSLNFQERFWARLNALASDANLSEWLKEDDTDSSSAADLADLAEPLSEADLAPNSATDHNLGLSSDSLAAPQNSEMIVHPTARPPEDQWVAQEIVVEDDPVIATALPAEPTPEVLSPALLDPDALVPNPQLEVQTGELVSGKSVSVRVRMPDLPCRIYVKLWVNDRQTRSLLDGPRWLVDFTPTGLGDLEATTQMTVPFGSLEIQFEAIAIEMATQRESHKVVATRMVVPPDTPTLSYPEWD